MHTICGTDCTQCSWKETCGGCAETNGHPFGGACIVAACCRDKGHERCGKCLDTPCKLKEQLVAEFNALSLEDMEEVTDLNALKGSFINLDLTLPSGQAVRWWEDDKIYLGNQVGKKGSTRCYGLAADERHLLVCEYGEGGSDAEIVLYKRRNGQSK